jgi:hypothetical protein
MAKKRKALRTAGKRLNLGDRYRLLELHKTNPSWNYEQLAEATGIGYGTVRLTCLAASKSAADLMGAYAGPVLLQWLKALKIAATRGDYRPARDWLLHAGSIEPLPDTAKSTGTSIVIVNTALPGMPGAPAIGTTIDVQTLQPRIAPFATQSVTKGNTGPDNQ